MSLGFKIKSPPGTNTSRHVLRYRSAPSPNIVDTSSDFFCQHGIFRNTILHKSNFPFAKSIYLKGRRITQILLLISIAVACSGLINHRKSQLFTDKINSRLYTGFLTLAIVWQLPAFLAIRQHSRLTSSALVTAIRRSAPSMPGFYLHNCNWRHFQTHQEHPYPRYSELFSICIYYGNIMIFLNELLGQGSSNISASYDYNSHKL